MNEHLQNGKCINSPICQLQQKQRKLSISQRRAVSPITVPGLPHCTTQHNPRDDCLLVALAPKLNTEALLQRKHRAEHWIQSDMRQQQLKASQPLTVDCDE